MGRNTIVDVRERIEAMNSGTVYPERVSFNCWGVGQNRYQLINEQTGKTYGPVCLGASEFLKVIEAFKDGRRLGQGPEA